MEFTVNRERLDAFDLLFETRYPTLADIPREERAQIRITQRDPAPRRHTVRDVQEFSGAHTVEVAQHGFLEQIAMEGGNPVDRVTADAGKVRHAHGCVPRFIDERE